MKNLLILLAFFFVSEVNADWGKEETYPQLKLRAEKENKRLIVFVNCEAKNFPLNKNDLVYRTTSFVWGNNPRIIISKPIEGVLYFQRECKPNCTCINCPCFPECHCGNLQGGITFQLAPLNYFPLKGNC